MGAPPIELPFDDDAHLPWGDIDSPWDDGADPRGDGPDPERSEVETSPGKRPQARARSKPKVALHPDLFIWGSSVRDQKLKDCYHRLCDLAEGSSSWKVNRPGSDDCSGY